jgi:hypothetical protein
VTSSRNLSVAVETAQSGLAHVAAILSDVDRYYAFNLVDNLSTVNRAAAL